MRPILITSVAGVRGSLKAADRPQQSSGAPAANGSKISGMASRDSYLRKNIFHNEHKSALWSYSQSVARLLEGADWRN